MYCIVSYRLFFSTDHFLQTKFGPLTPPWEPLHPPPRWTLCLHWRRSHQGTAKWESTVTSVNGNSFKLQLMQFMFNDPVCKWNEKKQHLFNPFNTLVLLEWLEKVTHVVFFETRLKDKKKKKGINKCSQGKLVLPACVWQHQLLIGVGYIQSSFASLPISWTNCPSCPGFGWFLKWEWVCEKFQDPKRRKKIVLNSY